MGFWAKWPILCKRLKSAYNCLVNSKLFLSAGTSNVQNGLNFPSNFLWMHIWKCLFLIEWECFLGEWLTISYQPSLSFLGASFQPHQCARYAIYVMSLNYMLWAFVMVYWRYGINVPIPTSLSIEKWMPYHLLNLKNSYLDYFYAYFDHYGRQEICRFAIWRDLQLNRLQGLLLPLKNHVMFKSVEPKLGFPLW